MVCCRPSCFASTWMNRSIDSGLQTLAVIFVAHSWGLLGTQMTSHSLSPSVVGARHLVATCKSFAKEFDVIFNAAKSAHLVFGHKGPHCGLLINGIAIPKVDKAQLLGSWDLPIVIFSLLVSSFHTVPLNLDFLVPSALVSMDPLCVLLIGLGLDG